MQLNIFFTFIMKLDENLSLLALITPQFAPNLYDLSAMLQADKVILMDLERWSRKGRTHRIMVPSQNGPQWLSLPIKTKDKKKTIKDVRIDHTQNWEKIFLNTLEFCYNSATYYDYYADELIHDIKMAHKFERLIDFNLYFFQRLLLYFEIDIDYKLASDLPYYDENPDVLRERLGYDVVVMEHHSRNYLRQPDFSSIKIESHPIYKQAQNHFLPGCSALDLLLNHGVESFRVLEQLS